MPLGGTGSLGGTGQTSSSRGSGDSATGHEAPLVKTVFSEGTQRTKSFLEVFSSQVRLKPPPAEKRLRRAALRARVSVQSRRVDGWARPQGKDPTSW